MIIGAIIRLVITFKGELHTLGAVNEQLNR